MSWVRFSLAVVGTSLALVIGIFAVGAFTVGSAFASATPFAAMQNHNNWTIPPELASLKDVPQDQRFSHFKGVTANLTDKDGKPISINVTPGVATSISDTSLTINGNDGASHTYTVDSQTMSGKSAPKSGENVVVVTLNNSSTATAVIAPQASANGWGGHGGPPFNR